MIPSLLLLPALLGACHRDKGDDSAPPDTSAPAWSPDLACPGDEGCASGDGALNAGAAIRTITPTCFESWEDLDANGEYDDPISGNIPWREVESLLHHLGATVESLSGTRIHIKLNGHEGTLHRPHHGNTLGREDVKHVREFLAHSRITPSLYAAAKKD